MCHETRHFYAIQSCINIIMESMNPSQVNSLKDFQQPSTSQTIPGVSQSSQFDASTRQQFQINSFSPEQRNTNLENSVSISARQQNIYRQKCILLEPHIQEAVLINKALRSELKQYRDKIKFEKKLCKYLVTRIKDIDP